MRKKAAPEHAGGKPFNNLTSKQKAAVIELAVTEDEWSTRTWDVHENYSKLAASEVRDAKRDPKRVGSHAPIIHLLENGGGSSSHFLIDKAGGDIQNQTL